MTKPAKAGLIARLILMPTPSSETVAARSSLPSTNCERQFSTQIDYSKAMKDKLADKPNRRVWTPEIICGSGFFINGPSFF
jgi:hypothetical protein